MHSTDYDRRRRQQRDGHKFSECPESPHGTTEQWNWGVGMELIQAPESMELVGQFQWIEMNKLQIRWKSDLETNDVCEKRLVKLDVMMNVEVLDKETVRVVARIAVLRISTKHINLKMRQTGLRLMETSERAVPMWLECVTNEMNVKKNWRSGQ